MSNQERTGTDERCFLRVPLAIVGMAVRLPGADNLEEYWRLLREGRDAIGELPPNRLDRELYYDPRKGIHGKTYSTLGGLISQRPFDRTVCPLSDELLGNADECHLTLCEVAAAACRHAGYDPLNLPLRNVGVYVGHSGGSLLPGEIACGTLAGEIAELLRPLESLSALPASAQEELVGEFVDQVRRLKPRRRADGGPDLAANAAASLLARAFGLNGPHMSMDAACASSLMALALAGQALQQGRIDMALVGGASFNKVDSLVLFSQAQSCSASGSRPFDAQADGLISSEGYVVVVVKALPRALADGDTVYSVIRGIGISTDGRGRSLWAPRREGQVAAVRRAYGPDVAAAGVQYIEAHATSTQVGDATEVEALAEVFGACLPAGTRIPIGSVKANIGHTLETAGLASLVKVILAMRHGVIPPTINVREPNKSIAWDQVPFELPLREQPWPAPADGQPRRAAVNAFGIGGLNVHLVVDETVDCGLQIADCGLESNLPSAIRNPQSAIRNPHEAVAIIGRGVILPGAQTVAAFWQVLVSGRDPKQAAPPQRWRADLGVRPGTHGPWQAANSLGGYITDFAYDWKKHKIPPKQIAHANPLQFMLLAAAEQALQEAGYERKPFDRSRAAVVVGTIFGGDFSHQLQLGLRLPEFQRILAQVLRRRGVAEGQIAAAVAAFGDSLLQAKPALFDETGSFTSSTLASRLSKTFDFMGGAVALDAAECSSLAALSVSIDMLLTGACNFVLCAGAQRSMDLVFYESHTMNGLLSPGEPRPSLDAGACGMVPGEGVVVVLLKRLADARRDGDPIHGVIRSCGAASDQHQARNALKLAMQRALASAPKEKSEIRNPKSEIQQAVAEIEIAGWSLPALDTDEAEAIGAVYGQAPRRQPLLLGSTTAQIGHLQGAQGLVSLVKATLALEHGELPGTFGQTQPAPVVAENNFCLLSQATPLPPSANAGGPLLGISSYALNGLAWHALVERGVPVSAAGSPPSASGQKEKAESPEPRAQSPEPRADFRIVRIGTGSFAELIGQLPKLADSSATLFAQAGARPFSPADRARLAVVANSPASLQHKLQLAAAQLSKPETRPVLEEQGIFCRCGPLQRPRVACLFPGQGSQYRDMLRETVHDVPAALARRLDLDAVMRRLGYPLFADLAWAGDGKLGTDLWHTQLAMLLADLIQWAALTGLGLVPDVVAGHSYGELVALVAAGAWDVEQAARSTRARCEAIAAYPENAGTLLSTSASLADVQKILLRLGMPVYVAAGNAPDQTVLGGAATAIAACADLLRQNGHETVPLPVPRPFHTPLLEPVQPAFQQALQQARLIPPRIPLLSSVTNRYVADPDDVRANLVAQLTSPVRYLDLVQRLASDGVTVFIEAGPQQVLTGLNRRILRDRDVLVIGSDHPKRHGLEQLRRVEALLECAGVLSPQAEKTALATSSIQPPAPGPEVIHFDATQQRRHKKRGAAAAVAAPLQLQLPIAHFDATMARRQASSAVGGRRSAIGHRPSATGQEELRIADCELRIEEDHYHNQPPTADSRWPTADSRQPTADSRQPIAGSRQPIAGSRQPIADLEKFLINFVVEQTGYPPEVVELDADLEADLGIDSIKKAQLFGELREYFDITPSDDLTLDDFPTLRHVLNFLAKAPGKGDWLKEPAVGDRPSVPGERTADRRQPTAGSRQPTADSRQPAADSRQPIAGSRQPMADAELEAFLVNFVVEQTGYPPEVVELDADLEADLGIDSIKKAQLFGELREYFDITPSDDLTLDDFPTLRHVQNYLASSAIGHRPSAIGKDEGGRMKDETKPPREGSVHPSSFILHPSSRPIADSRQPIADSRQPVVPVALSHRPIILSGTPYDMGFQQALVLGCVLRPVIQKFADRTDSVAAAQASCPATVMEEMRGLADGLEVPLSAILAHQEQAGAVQPAGSALVAVTAARNGSAGMLLGAVESSQPAVTGLHGRVGLFRQPLGKTGHVTATVAGQMCGLHGLNAHGLAVLSGPLQDGRSSPESENLSQILLVKTLLENARDIDGALEIIRTFPRRGSWTVCLAHHPTDRLCHVEFDGAALAIRNDVDFLIANNQRQLLPPLPNGSDDGHRRWDCWQQQLEATGRNELTPETLGSWLKKWGVPPSALVLLQPAVGHRLSAIGQEELRIADYGLRIEEDHYHNQPPTADSRQPAADSRQPATGNRQPTADSRTPTAEPRQPNPDSRQPNPGSRQQVTYRYLLRMVDAPRPADSSAVPTLHGPAVIVGVNPVSDALRSRLLQLGARVFQLAASDQPEGVVEELRRLWCEQPLPHLFLTTPFDADAVTSLEQDAWLRRRRRGIILPYLVCQAWVKLVLDAKLMDEASLFAATALGGDFGLSGQIPALESGALTGLLKGIMIESWVQGHRQTSIKLIDTSPGTAPETIAEALLAELAAPSKDVEIACVEGRRQVVRAFPEALPADQRDTVPRGGTWVLSGGARGITAQVARALGQRYGLKLHLLGTAPPPQVDPAWRDLSEEGRKQLKVTAMQEARAQGLNPLQEWQKVEKGLEIDATLRDFAALGIQATYHSCDVSDRRALAQVLERIRAMAGPIQGIIHGAGIGQDARFERKKRDQVEQCFAAKIDGAAALMELTWNDPLRYFVAFGSISGRFGANGCTDYSAANDMMCKQVDWFRRQRPDCAAVAFHWHAWGDFGMATKPEIKLGLEMVNMNFMPAVEGVQHLLAELEAGAPEGEVLITDEAYYKLFYPSEAEQIADCGLRIADLQTTEDSAAIGNRQSAIGNPFVERITKEGPDRLLAEVRLDPNSDPFLREHQLQQRPLLPIVIGLEALCEAATQLEPGKKVAALHDVQAVKGLRFHTPQPITARVVITRGENGIVGELRADFHNRLGRLVEADRLYLKATMELAQPTSDCGLRIADCGLDPLQSEIRNPQSEMDWHPIQYLGPDAPIYHGPPLQGLQSVWMTPGRALGRIKVLPLADLVGPRDLPGWIVPSGSLDACLYATAVFAWKTLKPAPSLPLSIGRLLLGPHPRTGDECVVEVQLAEQEKGGARCHFRLVDSTGALLLEAQDYRIVWLA